MEMQYGLGMGNYQGRARNVSAVVQRLDGEYSESALQTQAKAFATTERYARSPGCN
jgi:hypothetical protein